MAQGQCNCGAVRFEINSEISDVYICHCSVCRKSSGNNGVAVVIVANEFFHWTMGEEQVAIWKKPDEDWLNCFCRRCGSQLPRINDDLHMAVPAGLITVGGESLKVVHHIWVGSKAVWDVIGDSGKLHLET